MVLTSLSQMHWCTGSLVLAVQVIFYFCLFVAGSFLGNTVVCMPTKVIFRSSLGIIIFKNLDFFSSYHMRFLREYGLLQTSFVFKEKYYLSWHSNNCGEQMSMLTTVVCMQTKLIFSLKIKEVWKSYHFHKNHKWYKKFQKLSVKFIV